MTFRELVLLDARDVKRRLLQNGLLLLGALLFVPEVPLLALIVVGVALATFACRITVTSGLGEDAP